MPFKWTDAVVKSEVTEPPQTFLLAALPKINATDCFLLTHVKA